MLHKSSRFNDEILYLKEKMLHFSVISLLCHVGDLILGNCIDRTVSIFPRQSCGVRPSEEEVLHTF